MTTASPPTEGSAPRRKRKSRSDKLRKRYVKRRHVLALGLLVLALFGLLFVSRMMHFYGEKVMYIGASYSDPQLDTLYYQGSPNRLGRPDPVDSRTGQPVGPGSSVYAYNRWIYEIMGGAEITFEFDPATKRLLWVQCVDREQSGSCPSYLGIPMGYGELDVTRKLGRESRDQILGLTKVVEFDDLGMDFEFRANELYAVKIRKPEPDPGRTFQRALRWTIRSILPLP